MPIRREPRPPGSHLIGTGKFRAIITLTGGPDMRVEICYFELKPSEIHSVVRRPTPENAEVVALQTGLEASTLSEGKAIAREVLVKLASGDLVADRIPFESPPNPERITEIAHQTLPLKAIIYRWQHEYEVRTIGYVSDGFTLPTGTPSVSPELGFEWGQLDLFVRLLADTEEEAIRAAQEEMDRLASSDIPFGPSPMST